jgi:hypothetical protein
VDFEPDITDGDGATGLLEDLRLARPAFCELEGALGLRPEDLPHTTDHEARGTHRGVIYRW